MKIPLDKTKIIVIVLIIIWFLYLIFSTDGNNGKMQEINKQQSGEINNLKIQISAQKELLILKDEQIQKMNFLLKDQLDQTGLLYEKMKTIVDKIESVGKEE